MAGFLDKNTRIIDMVLTGYGKELLSQGELRFVYWAAFDDEVDYDPYIADSGSLSDVTLVDRRDEALEETLVAEATTGYKRTNRSGSDHTNVFRPLFDMPQGQTVLPQLSSSTPASVSIEVKHRKVLELQVKRDQKGKIIEELGPFDRGYQRFDSSAVHMDYGYTPDSYPKGSKLEGFLLRVFESGSEGVIEIDERRDLNGEIAFNNDLKLLGGK